jgi:hypothetical protein
VEISPEDRARIYEEEKARREAREKLDAKAIAKDARAIRVGAWLIVVAVIAVVIMINVFYGHGSESSQQEDSEMAYDMAKEFIRDQLKAPSTADFAYLDRDVSIVTLGNGAFKVSGWVDAQNSFGAKIRSKWACTLKRTTRGSHDWEVAGFCGLLE